MYNAGDALVWADGNQIWRYALEGSPEVVYTGDAGDWVGPVVASDAGYLFVEEKRQKGLTQSPKAPWRLYFLAAGSSTPVLIERYTNDQLGNPNIAINDTYLAWSPSSGTYSDPVVALRFARVDQLDQPRTLFSYHAETRSLGDVALWRDELWYYVSENDFAHGRAYPHIEMVDLLHPDAGPTIYGSDERALMPAANDQVVAFQGGGSPEDGMGQPAWPYIYWRATGTYQQVPLPHYPNRETAEIQFPTVGNRFVAWWDYEATQFYVYDLAQHALRRIVENDPHGPRYLQPSVSGNLLSWVYFANDQTPGRIQWAYLPD